MSIYEIRNQINIELAKPQPNEARVTELIIKRDELSKAETHTTLTAEQWGERMLDATFA